jgi:hypothetical protein
MRRRISSKEGIVYGSGVVKCEFGIARQPVVAGLADDFGVKPPADAGLPGDFIAMPFADAVRPKDVAPTPLNSTFTIRHSQFTIRNSQRHFQAAFRPAANCSPNSFSV